MNKCSDCKYFQTIDYDDSYGQDFGYCKRYPPQLIGSVSITMHNNCEFGSSAFPTTLEDDFCGEFIKP